MGPATLYQTLRRAMVDATETLPGTDPDRAGFTIALQAAQDQVITASDIHPLIHPTGQVPGPHALTGAIGRAVLDNLLPARRSRSGRGHCIDLALADHEVLALRAAARRDGCQRFMAGRSGLGRHGSPGRAVHHSTGQLTVWASTRSLSSPVLVVLNTVGGSELARPPWMARNGILPSATRRVISLSSRA
jgi:hypothetical protein